MATWSDFFKLQHGRTRGLSSVVPQGRIDGNRDRSFDTTWYVPQIWSIWLTRLVFQNIPQNRNQHNWNTNTTTGRSPFVPKSHTKKTPHKVPGYETGLQTSNIRDCKVYILQSNVMQVTSHQVPNFPRKPGLISCAFFIRHVCGDLFCPILPAIWAKEMQTKTFRKIDVFYKYFVNDVFRTVFKLFCYIVGTYCIILRKYIYIYMMHHQNILYNIIYSRSNICILPKSIKTVQVFFATLDACLCCALICRRSSMSWSMLSCRFQVSSRFFIPDVSPSILRHLKYHHPATLGSCHEFY